MRSVRSKDTGPEMFVRRVLHSLGFRYRLHRKDLPGTPDMVFPRLRKAVFVHGCFWHGHNCQRGSRTPRTNRDYWTAKIAKNRSRDQANRALLEAKGWGVYVVWECQIKNTQAFEKLKAFLQ